MKVQTRTRINGKNKDDSNKTKHIIDTDKKKGKGDSNQDEIE